MTSRNVRTFELKLGRRALILFILGMSCLLFGVFLFGVTVGKNIDTYPERYARGIPGMLVEKLGWSSGRAEIAGNVGEAPKEAAKADVEEKTAEDKKAPVAIPAGSEEKQAAPAANGEKKNSAPPAVEQSAQKTSPVKDKYQVQVASLKEKEKADKFCKQLVEKGFKPKVVAMELPEKGKWYRVMLDGFETREQAQKTADGIAKKIKGLTCVVSKMEEKNN